MNPAISIKKVIPFFSVLEINEIKNFRRFRNTRNYIKELSAVIQDRLRPYPELVALKQRSGYAKLDKFHLHRQEWDALRRKIPLRYLEAIGANINDIKFAVEADKIEFNNATSIPLFPRYAVQRAMAAVYITIEIPPGTPEAEAVNRLQALCNKKRFRCCINYPELKTIWIEPNEDPQTNWYYPELRLTKDSAIFSRGGYGIGSSYLC